MKFVLNKCYGGFGLSDKAEDELKSKLNLEDFFSWEIARNNEALVEIVERLGAEANGSFAELKVVDIPDENTDYEIDNYDGIETITYVLNGKLHYA